MLDDFYLKCRGAQITRSEREFIKLMAASIEVAFSAPVFVNIGVMYGATMHCLRAGSGKALLIGVDIKDERHVQERDHLCARFLQGDSGILGKRFTDAIHLLLVDGCHYYGTVKADIDGWGPRIVRNGIIIFHDYDPTLANLARFPELMSVRVAVDEWHNKNWQPIDAPDSLACFERVA